MPFFLGEVTQQLLEQQTLFDQNGWRPDLDIFNFEVPESVRLTIENRLQALQPSTQRILVAACPMGREFEFEFLAALSDLSEDDLVDAVDEAERARLIASTVDAGRVRFSFAHELVRQTLLSQQSHTRRQRLHLRVADALERIHAAVLPEYATSIAYHLREAGPFADPDRIVSFLRIAGARALQAAAFEEAVRHLGLVLSMVDEGDSAGRAPVLEQVARANEVSETCKKRSRCGTQLWTRTKRSMTPARSLVSVSMLRSKWRGGRVGETSRCSWSAVSMRSATKTTAHGPASSLSPA